MDQQPDDRGPISARVMRERHEGWGPNGDGSPEALPQAPPQAPQAPPIPQRRVLMGGTVQLDFATLVGGVVTNGQQLTGQLALLDPLGSPIPVRTALHTLADQIADRYGELEAELALEA
jgi:hypothetical protein